jgi:hypothetical protein
MNSTGQESSLKIRICLINCGRIDDARADGSGKAVDIRGREQIVLLITANGPQLKGAGMVDAFQDPSGVRTGQNQPDVRPVRMDECRDEVIDPLPFLYPSDADNVLLRCDAVFR